MSTATFVPSGSSTPHDNSNFAMMHELLAALQDITSEENDTTLRVDGYSIPSGSNSSVQSVTASDSPPSLGRPEPSEGGYQSICVSAEVEMFDDAIDSVIADQEAAGEELDLELLQFRQDLAERGEFIACVDQSATLKWVERVFVDRVVNSSSTRASHLATASLDGRDVAQDGAAEATRYNSHGVPIPE